MYIKKGKIDHAGHEKCNTFLGLTVYTVKSRKYR